MKPIVSKIVVIVSILVIVFSFVGCSGLFPIVTRIQSKSGVAHKQVSIPSAITEEEIVRVWSVPSDIEESEYVNSLGDVVIASLKELVPFGLKLIVETKTVTTTVGGEDTVTESAETSTDISGDDDALSEELGLIPGVVSLPSGLLAKASNVTTKTEGKASMGMVIVFAIGSLAVIGGLVLAMFIPYNKKIGIVVSIGGFALIFAARAMELYPWLPLALIVIFSIVVLVVILLKSRKTAAQKVALSTIVRGVQLSPNKGKAVRDEIEKQSGKNEDIVRAVVTSIKKEERLK